MRLGRMADGFSHGIALGAQIESALIPQLRFPELFDPNGRVCLIATIEPPSQKTIERLGLLIGGKNAPTLIEIRQHELHVPVRVSQTLGNHNCGDALLFASALCLQLLLK